MSITLGFEISLNFGCLGELEVDVTGEYTPSTPDVHYLPNGDPGYPGDASEFDVTKAEWTYEHKFDLKDMLDAEALEAIQEKADEVYGENS